MTTFSNSSISTNSWNSISFSGTNGIAGSFGTGGLVYSSNSGTTWSNSNDSSNEYITVSLSGSNGLAAAYGRKPTNTGLWITSNSGVTWAQVANTNPAILTTEDVLSVAIDGTTGLAGPYLAAPTVNTGIYRSTDSGVTWTQVLSNDVIRYIYLSGSTAVAFSNQNSSANGIRYSTNGGATWTTSANTAGGNVTGNWNNASFVGTNGIAGSNLNTGSGGIWYTSNSGQSWTQSPSYNSGIVYSVSMSGTNAIAATNGNGLWYSTNSGQNWVQSASVTTGIFFGVTLSGSIGIAAALAGGQNGIWTTDDAGQTWTKSPSTTGAFRTTAIVGTNGIAGSSASGIWVNTSPLCYGENTRILCLINDEEKYVNISDITVGTLVKTYKCGYKPVKYIGSFDHTTFNKSNPLDAIYKMNNSDLIVTGGHSILVDELTEEEIKNNLKFGFTHTILDKKLVLACSSDKFTLLNNKEKVNKLFHLVLENDDINGNYGIYVNDGILSETCNQSNFSSFLSTNHKTEELIEDKTQE